LPRRKTYHRHVDLLQILAVKSVCENATMPRWHRGQNRSFGHSAVAMAGDVVDDLAAATALSAW
jgi:hypothetical protein